MRNKVIFGFELTSLCNEVEYQVCLIRKRREIHEDLEDAITCQRRLILFNHDSIPDNPHNNIYIEKLIKHLKIKSYCLNPVILNFVFF